jgi:hypothetical protein
MNYAMRLMQFMKYSGKDRQKQRKKEVKKSERIAYSKYNGEILPVIKPVHEYPS